MAKKNNAELNAFAKKFQISIDNEFQNPCVIDGHLVVIKPLHISSATTLEDSIYRLVKHDIVGGT